MNLKPNHRGQITDAYDAHGINKRTQHVLRRLDFGTFNYHAKLKCSSLNILKLTFMQLGNAWQIKHCLENESFKFINYAKGMLLKNFTITKLSIFSAKIIRYSIIYFPDFFSSSLTYLETSFSFYSFSPNTSLPESFFVYFSENPDAWCDFL